jgi:hypothetical protein
MMDENRREDLEEAQHRNEIQTMTEFDFTFPRCSILPKDGATILRLQRFGVVHIMELDLDQAQVGDLAIHVSHSSFYSKVHVWLKTSDGARSWMTIATTILKKIKSTIFVQPIEY